MAIQYTKSEGVSIGYRVTGEGAETAIFVPGVFSNLAMDRYFPESVAWEKFLQQFGRVVTFDKRATGVSDRSARPLNLDQQVVDVEAVRVASGSEKFTVCGLSAGAPLAVLYALAYPERVRSLILMEGVCCDAKDPYARLSDSNTLFDWERSISVIDSDFEQWCADFMRMISPDANPEQIESEIEYMHATASPAAHRFIWCSLMGFDLRPMLRHIFHPTLVIHATGDQLYSVEHGRYLAEHISGAEYLELDSNCHVPMYAPDVLPVMQERIERFMAGLPSEEQAGSYDRAISTVLFSDISDSTVHQSSLGDRAWSSVIGEFEKSSEGLVIKCRGRIVKYTGDGVMATFDVPGDALRAAKLLIEDADRLGYPIRVGLHTGEVQKSGNDVHGMAVNIASRVADQAKPGEALTTSITQGIVEGGDHRFNEYGIVDLKGVGERSLVRIQLD